MLRLVLLLLIVAPLARGASPLAQLIVLEKLATLTSLKQPSTFAQAEELISQFVSLEDPLKSFSDGGLVALLKEKGLLLLDSSVALHRKQLGIPDFRERKRDAIKGLVTEIIDSENKLEPLSDAQLSEHMQQQYDVSMPPDAVAYLRYELGINSAAARKITPARKAIKDIIDKENPLMAYNDGQIATLLEKQGISMSGDTVHDNRTLLGIPNSIQRKVTAIENEIRTLMETEDRDKPYTTEELVALLVAAGAEEMSVELVREYRNRVGEDTYLNKLYAARERKFKELIADESKFAPRQDKELAELMSKLGLPMRTNNVRRLRYQLGIPSAAQRLQRQARDGQIRQKIQRLVANENPFVPLAMLDLVAQLQAAGFTLTEKRVLAHLRALGIPPSKERKKAALLDRIAELIADEDKSSPLSDQDLAAQLRDEGVALSSERMQQLRLQLAIPHYKKRMR